MSNTLIYCSDDRQYLAQLKRRYRLKPLLLYEQGLYGNAPHLALPKQEQLLISLNRHNRRGGNGGNTLAYIAELSASLLGSRSIGDEGGLVVTIVTKGVLVGADNDEAIADDSISSAVDSMQALGNASVGSWTIAKRVCIEGREDIEEKRTLNSNATHQQQANETQCRDGRYYYFDLIDIPAHFSLCDIRVPKEAHEQEITKHNTHSAAAPSKHTDAPLIGIEPFYASLYDLLTHYLSPHQILTVSPHPAANENSTGAAAPQSLSAVCNLAEQYLSLQQRDEYQRSNAIHQQVIEHCISHYRLSQSEISQLNQRLQRHPHIKPRTLTALLDCNSYADVTVMLN